jgi:hypothetical protein
MDDWEKRERRALCDQFRALMQQQAEVLAYDDAAKQRFGQMIGRSPRGRSQFAYHDSSSRARSPHERGISPLQSA